MKATVLQIKWQNVQGRSVITNIGVFPWDNLQNLKQKVKQSMPAGCRVLSMRKTAKDIRRNIIQDQ